MMTDELSFWLQEHPRIHFPEPTSNVLRKSSLGRDHAPGTPCGIEHFDEYHLPGIHKPDNPPILITSLRAVMTRTMPRREFIIASKTIRTNQTSPRANSDVRGSRKVTKRSMSSWNRAILQRGGILDIWGPSDPFPARLEFFGDVIDSLRQFDPTTQRTVRTIEKLMITPAREFLPEQQFTNEQEQTWMNP